MPGYSRFAVGLSLLAGMALFVATGAGTSATADEAADWAKVVAAAKKEGKVTLYNGTTFNTSREIAKQFEAAYGIQVDLVEARPSEIHERVRTEQAAGRFIGDLRLSGYTTGAPEQKLGFYQEHGPLPNIARLKPAFVVNGTILQVTYSIWAIAVNTSLVKPEDEPKSWFDVLDPKWRGKILYSDPRVGGYGQVATTVFYDRFGPEFLDKLAAQKPTLFLNPPVAERQLAQGEYPLLVPFIVADLVNLRGLPIKSIMPKEGAPYVSLSLAMLKNAPHPNAARLFMNFYLDDRAQRVFADSGSGTVTGVSSPKLPEDVRALLAADLIGSADPFKLPEMVDIYKAKFAGP